MCRIDVKYQYTIRAMCTYARVFRKRPGCALIGPCALIRTNTVVRCSVLMVNLGPDGEQMNHQGQTQIQKEANHYIETIVGNKD